MKATKVVVYIGSPGDSRRQTLIFDLFFDTTRNLPPQISFSITADNERTISRVFEGFRALSHFFADSRYNIYFLRRLVLPNSTTKAAIFVQKRRPMALISRTARRCRISCTSSTVTGPNVKRSESPPARKAAPLSSGGSLGT